MENFPKIRSPTDIRDKIKKIFDILKWLLLVPFLFVIILNFITYFLPYGAILSPTLILLNQIAFGIGLTALIFVLISQFMFEIIFAKDIGHIELATTALISLTILMFYSGKKLGSVLGLLLSLLAIVAYVVFFIREFEILKKIGLDMKILE